MLNRWETFFLIIATVPIMGHVQILPLMYDVAGRDSWISALLSFPIGIGLIFVIYRLRIKFPDQDFPQIAQQIIGKFFGKALVLVIVLYFLFLSAFSAAALADMAHIAFLSETPVWALVTWFFLFCLYAAYKGTKIIALTAMIVGFIAVITGHSISILDMPEKEFQSIFPLFEFGFAPILWGTLVLVSVWIELLFLLFLKLKNIRQERFLLFWILGGTGICLTMISTMTGTVMIFGIGQADNFNYPALETVRILTLGFIDRLDIYGLILMAFGCYIRSSLFFRLCYDQLVPNKGRKWVKGGIFCTLGVISIALAVYIAQDYLRVEYFTILYTNALIFTPIPFLLLFLSWFKRSDEKQISG